MDLTTFMSDLFNQQASSNKDEQTQGYQPDKLVTGLNEVGGLLGTLASGLAPQQDSWQYRLGSLVAQQAKGRMEDERNKILMSQLFQQANKEQQSSQQATGEFNQLQSVAQPQNFDTSGPSTASSSLNQKNSNPLAQFQGGLGQENLVGGLMNLFSLFGSSNKQNLGGGSR